MSSQTLHQDPFWKKIFDKLLIYDIPIMTTGKFREAYLVG